MTKRYSREARERYSREAAQECSPGRKPWVPFVSEQALKGRKTRRTLVPHRNFSNATTEPEPRTESAPQIPSAAAYSPVPTAYPRVTDW